MSETHDIHGLKELGDGDLAFEGETIADCLEIHEAFKDKPIPDCIPGPARIREDAQLVKQTSNAARLDPSKEPERRAAREKMIQSIRFSCQYVGMYAEYTGNPGLLDTIGVDRAAQRAPRNAAVKATKKDFNRFTVTHGKVSGTAKVHVSSWPGKGSVDLHICYGNPELEESWQPFRIAHHCNFTLEGLEPARRAYFRARLLNDSGIGPWSETVELIII
uniref:Fibronectin type III domain-containing protein n=1 Tax=Geobacter sp. (strain M21) TaxID=443144 RepID=C6E3Q6_GEOSM